MQKVLIIPKHAPYISYVSMIVQEFGRHSASGLKPSDSISRFRDEVGRHLESEATSQHDMALIINSLVGIPDNLAGIRT